MRVFNKWKVFIAKNKHFNGFNSIEQKAQYKKYSIFFNKLKQDLDMGNNPVRLSNNLSRASCYVPCYFKKTPIIFIDGRIDKILKSKNERSSVNDDIRSTLAHELMHAKLIEKYSSTKLLLLEVLSLGTALSGLMENPSIFFGQFWCLTHPTHGLQLVRYIKCYDLLMNLGFKSVLFLIIFQLMKSRRILEEIICDIYSAKTTQMISFKDSKLESIYFRLPYFALFLSLFFGITHPFRWFRTAIQKDVINNNSQFPQYVENLFKFFSCRYIKILISFMSLLSYGYLFNVEYQFWGL